MFAKVRSGSGSVNQALATFQLTPDVVSTEATLKILYVEDNRGDYILVREHLRECFGSQCALDWAANEAEAVARSERVTTTST
jgi:hypothetical protein